MYLKKRVERQRVLLLVLALVWLVGCQGPSGEAYQKYWWAGSLGYIQDTNPSTPETIYNDVYFSTQPGSYYVQYQAFDGSEWYLYYTITVEPGGLFLEPGPDNWFEIGLYSTGPVLYEWNSPRNLVDTGDAPHTEWQLYSDQPQLSQSQAPSGGVKGEIVGTLERRYEFGSIRLEYGRIER